jgi:hypothetical protein
MASVSEISIPGVGTGILYPKISNRFLVEFFDQDGGQCGEWLTQQVISIATLTKNFTGSLKKFGLVSVRELSTTILVEDDVTNHAAREIAELAGMNEDGFEIHVTQIDGDEKKLNTTILKDCVISGYMIDALDYGFIAPVSTACLRSVGIEYSDLEEKFFN